MSHEAVRRALVLERMRKDSAIVHMIRQDLMPVIVGLLSTYLGGEERRVSAPDLHQALDEDLEELRRNGWDLPKMAQKYCADWVRDGLLARHPDVNGLGETYELTADARAGIRFLEQIAQPLPSVTESKLASLIHGLDVLATDTDQSITARLRVLGAQRDHIEALIEATRRGEFQPIDDKLAVERLRHLYSEALDVPADFARVRDIMEQLNRDLRRELIEDDVPQGVVLDDIFTGVDRLHSSPEGHSFDAFFALVMDPESEQTFSAAIERLSKRSFAQGAQWERISYLTNYMNLLQDNAVDVNRMMGAFSKSLRQFVQSRQFQIFRELAERLRLAEREAALASAHVSVTKQMDWPLQATRAEFGSVGRLTLHRPSDMDARSELTVHNLETVSAQDLMGVMRESEIDFEELHRDVASAVASSPTGQVTIGEVLASFPATQGLASLVGLAVLGARFGSALNTAEKVEWSEKRDANDYGLFDTELMNKEQTGPNVAGVTELGDKVASSSGFSGFLVRATLMPTFRFDAHTIPEEWRHGGN